ncbi:hypothetical protein L2E82_35632 [Cichorium intybus]|uniref:Uncharacterized protein n=1 Tax=Cichorium intybus TaxID=13427 RepID=A0ACB9BPA9_CICIN|nr:hypothetical protein L2E82_35632 [Cichorium intybus]
MVCVAQEPSGEATRMSFIPPVSEFHIGSTSATGGAASAPAPIPSCTPPSIPPFQPLSQPQSTNPFTSAMSWGAPTHNGTPVSRQQTPISQPISQPAPVLFKPQATFQPIPPQQQYQQPPQQQYQYQEAKEIYDEEDEGWDKAKYWFTSLPSNSITTWDQLKAKFLQEFYPASKTTEIRRAIQDFQQNPGEAFHEAWDRLKELMRSCPHHDIPKWQLVKVFFEGASETNQAIINASSSGTIMMQDPEEAWRFLEQLSNGSKANFYTRKTVGTAAAVGADADWKKDVKKEISELNRKFDRLVSTLQNGPQSQPQGGQGGPKTQEANQVYGQG